VIMEDRVYRALYLRLPRSQIASEVDFAGLPLGTVSTKRSASMTKFNAAQQQQGHPKMAPWRRAPADDLKVPAQPGDERRNSDAAAFPDRENVEEVRAAAKRRVRDFARLIGILSGDAEVRTALIDSALSRSRAQLDARISRDSFWDRLVAAKFNDYQNNFEIPGLQDLVAEVTTDAAVQFRCGAELKRTGRQDQRSLSLIVSLKIFAALKAAGEV
jgi:hypothetical protein